MSNSGCFQVRVENIGFEAAHFATYGGMVEPLHGHSYRVAAEVSGALTEDAWVVDFGMLKKLLREACQQLDHKMLIQGESKVLSAELLAGSWQVRTPDDKRYEVPEEDAAVLSIENTTAECLAEWLTSSLYRSLRERGDHLESITVEVWEGPSQRASYRWVRSQTLSSFRNSTVTAGSRKGTAAP